MFGVPKKEKMKTIAAIMLGLGIGLAIGWTATALASSTEQKH
jgi:hypothetical protein